MASNPIDQSAVPPTQPGPLGTGEPLSRWPTVIGIISIVLGSLGILVWLWAMIAPFVMGSMLSNLPSAQLEAMEK